MCIKKAFRAWYLVMRSGVCVEVVRFEELLPTCHPLPHLPMWYNKARLLNGRLHSLPCRLE